MTLQMSLVHKVHLSMKVKVLNRNAYRVSSMNYLVTAIRLIASSAIGLVLTGTESWAQIPVEKSIPSRVETTHAESRENLAPRNTNPLGSDPDSGQALFSGLQRPVDDLGAEFTTQRMSWLGSSQSSLWEMGPTLRLRR